VRRIWISASKPLLRKAQIQIRRTRSSRSQRSRSYSSPILGLRQPLDMTTRH